MKAFAYRFIVKRARSRKLVICPLVSRAACSGILEMTGERGGWREIYSDDNAPDVLCKGGGEQIPGPAVPTLTGCLLRSLQRFLSAEKNRIPGASLPRCKAPGRQQIMRPGWRGQKCSPPAGRGRLVGPQKPGHFLTLVYHHLDGRTVQMAYVAGKYWDVPIICRVQPRSDRALQRCEHPAPGHRHLFGRELSWTTMQWRERALVTENVRMTAISSCIQKRS